MYLRCRQPTNPHPPSLAARYLARHVDSGGVLGDPCAGADAGTAAATNSGLGVGLAHIWKSLHPRDGWMDGGWYTHG